MAYAFYLASFIAIVATIRVISGINPIHALLYLVVSFLAIGIIFLILGAPFAAALEVIIYAGAIMVLFVFIVMMLSPGPRLSIKERQWLSLKYWIGPSILSIILLAELAWILAAGDTHMAANAQVPPRDVGRALFGPYLMAVEMASILLLAGLVGAYHLARHIYDIKQNRRGDIHDPAGQTEKPK